MYDISIEMSQNHDGLKMASAIFYKPPIAANELKHLILELFFTNSKMVLCYPCQKYFFKKYIINEFSMFF